MVKVCLVGECSVFEYSAGYNNEERKFKTVLVLDLPLQDQYLQQIAPSCHNNLKPFAPTVAIREER